MSVLALHMEKKTQKDIKGLQLHYQREVAIKNSEWRPEKRDENYNFTTDMYVDEHEKTNYSEKIKKIITNAGYTRKIKADQVLMSTFIISSDYDFFDAMPKSRQMAFFQEVNDWFCNRYGKENIVASIVHYDETTPHLHLSLVPITTKPRIDKRAKSTDAEAPLKPVKPKLSARDLFTPEEMLALQEELWRDVGVRYGLKRGKKGSAATHKSVKDFKAGKKVEALEAALADAQAGLAAAKGDLLAAKAQVSHLEAQLEAAMGTIEAHEQAWAKEHAEEPQDWDMEEEISR